MYIPNFLVLGQLYYGFCSAMLRNMGFIEGLEERTWWVLFSWTMVLFGIPNGGFVAC